MVGLRTTSTERYGEFLRNDVLDANNYFAQTKEPLKQNQFGASIGAPIRKDKTFVFGFYEGFREIANERDNADHGPIAQKQRTGDFSHSVRRASHRASVGIRHTSFFNVFANAPYPNNHAVPQQQIHPISQNLLSFFPLPERRYESVIHDPNLKNDTDQFGIKVDHYLNPRDTLSFRYMFYQFFPGRPAIAQRRKRAWFPVGEDQRAQNIVAQETHAFSSNLVLVARFSFLRNKFLFGERENHQPPSDFGFQYTPSLDIATGPPFIQVNGYSTVGDPITGPRNSYENVYDLLRIAELGAWQAPCG